MTLTLETVERETGPKPDSAIIWLHGLGADGHDFVPIVEEMPLAPKQVRYVFPHAPVRPVTLNGGLPMRAWFDVLSLERSAGEDLAGIKASAAAVDELIGHEIQRGIDSRRIVLAGFSQGGALALYCAARQSRRLAGAIGLSTYLPRASQLAEEMVPANRDLPIFLGHGTGDPLVAPALGEMSRDALLAAGFSPSWHTYPMAHGVCPQEIGDIAAWLRNVLGADQLPG
jgi:phospholipase/carboxylesterase